MLKFKSESRIETEDANPDTHIVSFDITGAKGGPCEWWCTPTGRRKGSDDHMEYEYSYILYMGQTAVQTFSRYRSEYSDDIIEFENCWRDICKGKFGDVLKKMSY